MQFLVFLFTTLNIQIIYPCTFWSFPVDQKGTTVGNYTFVNGTDCCWQKKIGGHTYNYVKMEDTSEYNCISKCVYTRIDEPNSLYCFKLGGSDYPECEEHVAISWFDGMEPINYCVAPGTNVTFYWPKHKQYNVIAVPKENYTSCIIENKTPTQSPFTYKPETTGIEYFASGFGSQCAHGTKARIFTDDNCTCKTAREPQNAWDEYVKRITHDLKQIKQHDNHNSANLNFTQFMDDLFKLNLIIISETQGEVLKSSTPCSPVRINCIRCFSALMEAVLGCTIDQKSLSCDDRINAANTSCFSCLCQITKTCITSKKCPLGITAPNATKAKENGTRHPCERDCSASEPMRCVYNLTLESLYSDVDGRRADGLNRTVLVYNGHLPGPPIVVCEEDMIVVNLKNGLSEDMPKVDGDNTTTLHFHGIRQINEPWGDGVPWVTQCPILPGQSFTYSLNTSNYYGAPPGTYTQPGTYWYHSHVGHQRTNGAYGALIIKPKKNNDYLDKAENTIMLQEWYDSPDQTNQTIKSLIINGNGRVGMDNFTTNYTVYKITEPGKLYLFRIIGSISQNVPLRLSIDQHTFTAVAADSQDIKPVHNLTDLWVAAGERFDIKVQTKNDTEYNSTGTAFKIRVFGYEDPNWSKTTPHCTIAWLKYPNQDVDYNFVTERSCIGFELQHPRRTLNPVPDKHEWANRIMNHTEWENTTGNIFINQLRALKMSPSLVFFARVPLGNMLLNTQYIELIGETFNNISMIYPEVPFLLQEPAINTTRCGQVCNIHLSSTTNVTEAVKVKYMKSTCTNLTADGYKSGDPCQHVVRQPYAAGYWIEMILINNKNDSPSHPIHIHGGWFWVLGMDKYPYPINRTFIEKKDGKNATGLHRNFDFPVAKDTIQVPPGGYVIVRYSANNAGTWIMHCHINKHVQNGMAMVVQIGGFGKEQALGQKWCTGPLKKNTVCKTPPPSPPKD